MSKYEALSIATGLGGAGGASFATFFTERAYNINVNSSGSLLRDVVISLVVGWVGGYALGKLAELQTRLGR